MVRQIRNLTEFNQVLQSAGNTLVVVDFTATWCGPCQFIGPKFEALSHEYKDVIFIKVDVDQARDVSAHCGIRSMPTFYFYKNGQVVHFFSGADERALREKVKQFK